MCGTYGFVVELLGLVQVYRPSRVIQKFSPRLGRFITVILLLAFPCSRCFVFRGFDRLLFYDVEEC